jgi:release factor glutamine methyltransferase
MTIKNALLWGIKKLKILERASHGDTAAFDAPILLAHTLKKSKEFLYTHPEKKLTNAQFRLFKKFVFRRAKHEPIAYIINHKEFFGLDFYVNKNVMIPRPETEILVEETIKNAKYQMPNTKTWIVDVGTGSGCIAISLAYHLPNAKIFATEISPGALKVAKKNAQHHKVAINFLRGNLLEPFIKRIKNQELKIKHLIIVANLPYLTTRQWQETQPEIKKYEPRLALDGGKDGLKYHRLLFKQILTLLKGRNLFTLSVILEIDPSQVKSTTKLIRSHFPTAEIQIKKDLANRDRVVIFHI